MKARIILCVFLLFAIVIPAQSQPTRVRWVPNSSGHQQYFDGTTFDMIFPLYPFVFMDQFPGDLINMTDWDTVGSEPDAGAISNDRSLFTNGAARLTTGTRDSSKFELTSELIFYDDNYAGFEARIKIIDVSAVAIYAGFASSAAFGEDSLAINATRTDGIFTHLTSNLAGFLLDADTTNNIWTAHSKAGTAGGLTVAVAAPTDSTTYTLRVELNPDGDVSYWVNGAPIETESAAITSGTALLLYLGILNRGAAANLVDIDYFFGWQRE